MTKRILYTAAALLCCLSFARAQVSIEQCVALAQENYPLIKKYDILNQTRDTDLSNINKCWLPQIDVYGQGTMQNAVPSFPEVLSDILAKTGADIEGLGKLQYKIGADLNQTIWDGGKSQSGRRVAETASGAQRATLDVQLYAIRERVENLFFGVLLTEEQIKQAEQTQNLLESNLAMLESMKSNGVTMQSDVDMVEAQLLTTGQQIIQAQSLSQSYRSLLSIYTGTDMATAELARPDSAIPGKMAPERPELAIFEAQIKANDARLEDVRAEVMPKIGFFAQAYYGYPGLNYFESMMNRNLSFNLLAGLKIKWNIGSLYTKKNNERKLRLANDGVRADREVFLFNTRMETESHTSRIRELKKVMANDARITVLRTNVRRAAESQLKNGIIDATTLLSKITDENQARLSASYHEIQLIQSIYQLKYTLNQ